MSEPYVPKGFDTMSDEEYLEFMREQGLAPYPPGEEPHEHGDACETCVPADC